MVIKLSIMNKKIIGLLVLLISFSDLNAQFVINSVYQPLSYEQLATPLREATRAFHDAEDKLVKYYEKAVSAIKKQDYPLAKFYIDKCNALNAQFDQHLCNQDDLNKLYDYYNQQKNYATTSYNNVEYQTIASNNDLKITKVSIGIVKTVIEFDYTNNYYSGGWCSINPNTYIQDVSTGKMYKLITSYGIPKSPNKYTFANQGDILHFKLVFPGVPSTTTKINMFEDDEGSVWRFYNIRIRNDYEDEF